MLKMFLAANLALASFATAPAHAAIITYTVSGTSPLADGGPLLPFMFTAKGDTTTLFKEVESKGAGTVIIYGVPVFDLAFTIDGASLPVNPSPAFLISNPSSASAAFYIDGFEALSLGGSGLMGYDLISPLTASLSGTIETRDIGQVLFTAAVVDVPTMPETGAVPEPATWAMMILGFGSVGAALRRGRLQPALAG